MWGSEEHILQQGYSHEDSAVGIQKLATGTIMWTFCTSSLVCVTCSISALALGVCDLLQYLCTSSWCV